MERKSFHDLESRPRRLWGRLGTIVFITRMAFPLRNLIKNHPPSIFLCVDSNNSLYGNKYVSRNPTESRTKTNVLIAEFQTAHGSLSDIQRHFAISNMLFRNVHSRRNPDEDIWRQTIGLNPIVYGPEQVRLKRRHFTHQAKTDLSTPVPDRSDLPGSHLAEKAAQHTV